MGRRNFTRGLRWAVLASGLSALGGCQAWYGGMTLPSPRYLEHPPQYFPAEPDFPLERELQYQDAISTQVRPGVASWHSGSSGRSPVPPVPLPPVVPVPNVPAAERALWAKNAKQSGASVGC